MLLILSLFFIIPQILAEEAKPLVEFQLSSSFNSYFFNFDQLKNDKEGDGSSSTRYDFSGRQKKLEYDFDPVLMLTLGTSLEFKFLKINLAYGDSGFLLQQNSGDENKPADAPEWMKASRSSLGSAALNIFDINLAYRSYSFSSGNIFIRDVSVDPLGEKGPKTNSFNYNINFREFESSYRIGRIYEFFKDRWNWKVSELVETFVIPLRIAYMSGQAEIPVIPYEFLVTRVGDQTTYTYASEGDLQQMKIKTSIMGIGWEWKYFDLYTFLGSTNISAIDDQGKIKAYKTDASIYRAKLKYRWIKESPNYTLTFEPALQINYYDFNDSPLASEDEGQQGRLYTSMGGNYYVVALGVTGNIKF